MSEFARRAALNSITNASATNPYVVKVMPGIYDLVTASLQMKEYVDLEGSGPENTIITSSNNNVDGGTCAVGTVLMANNSAIRNIKVVNTAPALGGDYIAVAALSSIMSRPR
jgi:pectin methylesterase-like acyl-CoA thioesterase